jgi:hypothetical protein
MSWSHQKVPIPKLQGECRIPVEPFLNDRQYPKSARRWPNKLFA